MQSTDQKLGKSKQIKRKSSIVDLFRHKLMRLWTLALICIWFANALVYYGLSFLSSQIGENIYYSMSMLSLVDIPGILLTAFFVEKYSRKAILITVMLLGGISCTVASMLPANYVDLKMWLAILGKCFIAGSFSLIYVFTVEIFPTVLRISGLGLCSVFARIGGMTAPYLLQLVRFRNHVIYFCHSYLLLLANIWIILPFPRYWTVCNWSWSTQCCSTRDERQTLA